MATLGRLSRLVEPQVSVLPGKYGTGALIASAIIAVDGTGFDRVCHAIQTGTMASGAGFDAEITESATVGGTYTLIESSGMAAITGGTGGKKVILIDDVLYTGRTIQAAISALQHFGRPEKIQRDHHVRSREARGNGEREEREDPTRGGEDWSDLHERVVRG